MAPTPAARHPHILVVDDEEAVRAAVARVLRRRGYTVQEAADGHAALAALAAACAPTSAAPIVAVITDLDMPRLDGVALGAAVARLRPGLPIIYMSGRHGPDRPAVLDAAPPGAFLPKPFEVPALLAAVEAALTSGPGDGRPPAARPTRE